MRCSMSPLAWQPGQENAPPPSQKEQQEQQLSWRLLAVLGNMPVEVVSVSESKFSLRFNGDLRTKTSIEEAVRRAVAQVFGLKLAVVFVS